MGFALGKWPAWERGGVAYRAIGGVPALRPSTTAGRRMDVRPFAVAWEDRLRGDPSDAGGAVAPATVDAGPPALLCACRAVAFQLEAAECPEGPAPSRSPRVAILR